MTWKPYPDDVESAQIPFSVKKPVTEAVTADPREYKRTCFRCGQENTLKKSIFFAGYEQSEKGYACVPCRAIIAAELKKNYSSLLQQYDPTEKGEEKTT